MVEVTSLDKVYQELSAGLGGISFEYPSETVISMMVDSPIDCEQPLFFSSVSHARERASSISRLAPSVTRVCILSRFVRRTKKKA